MPHRNSTGPGALAKPESLIHAVNQSEKIKDVVEECADELSSVNSVLKEELGKRPTHQGVEVALQKSDAIESKVQECAEDLSLVNQALQGEVRERQALEHELVDIKEREATARHEAFHDPLTSLSNRVLFNDRLVHGLAQAARHGWTLAVMFIDLDNFKSINDTYGHAAGDFVLHTVATRLKNLMRADDTLSRHGGDEFLYLLLELKNAQAAAVIAEKIIRTIGEPCLMQINGSDISYHIKLSIGIAIFPKDGETADALVAGADKAMYHAKKTRSGYAFAS
jgi:diguanylate cyclase (GGDEF)-like protein